MTTTEPTTEPTTALPLAPGSWALDPAHSAVNFTIRHLGVSKVRGRFARFTVDVQVGETLESTSVQAVIDVDSVDTGNPDRDAHVLAPDMVDVTVRPTLVFRSTSISGEGADWELVGDLTIGEVTRPVTLDVELGGLQEFPGGPRHAGFEATTQIRRQDFGLIPAVPSAMLGDVIKIELDLQLLEPSAA
ncbi:MAG TPA: YceI family protein [Acidimicrobiales bacterium]|nr:YceI family protein [Acidimicrobiales bacterium]